MAASQLLFFSEAVVELTSSLFAAIIWYYSYRAYRFLGYVSLLFLSASFMLFATGLLIQAVYTFLVLRELVLNRALFFGLGYLVYSLFSMSALLILAFAYAISPPSQEGPGEGKPTAALALAPISMIREFSVLRQLFGYLIGFFSTVLIFFVLAHMVSEYIEQRSEYTRTVMLGFGMMVIQQVIRLIDLDSDPLYLVSSIVQLVAFSVILYAVWRVSSK